MNKLPHDHLYGASPDDVIHGGNKNLTFGLNKQAAQDLQQNKTVVDARADALNNKGAFRVYQAGGKFERSFKVRYSDEIHRIDEVKGGHVTTQSGKTYMTKLVLPVPLQSETAPSIPFAARGSAQIENKQRTILKPFADRAVEILRTHGSNIAIWRLANELDKLGGFREATRAARLNQKSVLSAFLRTFPSLFRLSLPERGGTAMVHLIRKRITGKTRA